MIMMLKQVINFTQRDGTGKEEGGGGSDKYVYACGRIYFDVWQNQHNLVKYFNSTKINKFYIKIKK